jgi:filamentous hemagglutinin family protein
VPAWADVMTDGTAGPRVRLDGDFEIGADLGTRGGRNLFHSFERFSLANGERATFTGPNQIRNVISRVTGGERSDIDGAIRSTIPGADLYFLNPAGVVFGPNASLDLQGSFHVSTADELRFKDGAQFSASSPTASSFTVAAPEAFGFLGAHDPAPILVDRTTLGMAEGATLSLVGGPLEVRGGLPTSLVAAPAGTINLVAVAQPGEVTVGAGRLRTPPAAQLGPILITDEALVFAGLLLEGSEGLARLRLRGDTIVIDGAQLSLDNFTAQDLAGVIDIRGRQILVRNGDLTADALGAGAAGGIRIEAGEVLIIDRASAVRSNAMADGAAGAVTLLSPEGVIVISEGSFVASASVGGGAGGRIRVVAGELVAQGDGATQTGITTLSALDGGDAGRLTVEAGQIRLRDGGVLSSTTSGAGRGGAVEVTARMLTVIGPLSRVDSTTEGAGSGGSVRIAADFVAVGPGSVIASATLGPGAGGAVEITAGELVIQGAGPLLPAGVSALSVGPEDGAAGRIEITAGSVFIGSNGSLTAGSGGPFDAGPVRVTVAAGDLVLAGGVITNSTLSSATGDGGPIVITVERGDLIMSEGGTIASNNRGAGGPGSVRIEAGDVRLTGGSEIAAGTTASGQGGEIHIRTRRDLALTGSQILSSATGTGDAGDLEIVAGREIRLEDGLIASNASISGGGAIVIRAPQVIDLQDSEISTSVALLAGNAGDITIDPRFLILDQSSILARASAGQGGDIRITADQLLLSPGSEINAEAGEEGIDGTVVISAPEVDLAGGLVVLEGALLDAASQLRERCGARRDIGASSFTGVGRGGLPPTPDGPLSGAYLAAAPSGGGGLEGRAAAADGPAPAAPCLGAP